MLSFCGTTESSRCVLSMLQLVWSVAKGLRLNDANMTQLSFLVVLI